MQNRLISGEIPLRQMNTKVNIYCTHIRMETKHFPFQELNRVVVLTMARALQVNGLDQQSVTWVKDTLNGIMQKTPHRYRPCHFKCDEFHQHLILWLQLAVSNAGELPADHAGLLQGEPRAEGEHLPEQGAA